MNRGKSKTKNLIKAAKQLRESKALTSDIIILSYY